MLCKLKEEFTARNVNVVALGSDTGELIILVVRGFINIVSYFFNFAVSNNRRWIRDIEELQSVRVSVPLVSDIGSVYLRKASYC